MRLEADRKPEPSAQSERPSNGGKRRQMERPDVKKWKTFSMFTDGEAGLMMKLMERPGGE